MTLLKPTLEDIEIHLLLEGVYQYYGYDFRNYALSSLKRRIQGFINSEGLAEKVLQNAKSGIFSLKLMQEYTQLYLKAGGKKSFSEYYTAAYDNAIFRASLRENVVFAQHNLATDSSFNEFNVILCRNVLIYFNQVLQKRVHELFYNSLCTFGILGLGRQELLRFTPYEQYYEEIVKGEKLYKKIASL